MTLLSVSPTEPEQVRPLQGGSSLQGSVVAVVASVQLHPGIGAAPLARVPAAKVSVPAAKGSHRASMSLCRVLRIHAALALFGISEAPQAVQDDWPEPCVI